VTSEIIPWLGATSPPWFKAIFLIVIALAIPGFFVLMWLMSRRKGNKRNSQSDKKDV
jgi:hypothetical protein